ncbi:Cysteine-rich repeat secretory protein 55 [Striga hermonthica]|uniref:Cysteine-rich repeat secretory protein 55 n=1 Tax=Striga hermonthica TaxID=68872 RepID=A0A9N7RSS1_STRHE|nr:Cysteine-rich repeat secretory protein 55 [Striga hermonthica]
MGLVIPTCTGSSIFHLEAGLVVPGPFTGVTCANTTGSIHPTHQVPFHCKLQITRGPAQIYGLAQCRSDVPNNDCTACIREAARIVRDPDHCPTQSGARIWYDFCFLRYNTNSFAGQLDTSGWILWNVNNVTDPSAFNENLGNLMRNISSEAVRPGRRGLGKGTRRLTPLSTLYGLVQCTRDLSGPACAQCLATAIFPDVCVNRQGCRVLFGSCYVRYELYPFFFPLESGGSSGRGPGGSVKVKKVN